MNIFRVLVVIALLGIILSVGVFTLNQFAGVLDWYHDVQVRQAEAECALYGAPHAIVTGDTVFCHRIYEGSEQILPLEALEQIFSGQEG